MGDHPLVFGRRQEAVHARDDWFRLEPAGPRNLTAGFPAPPPTLLAAGRDAIVLAAAGVLRLGWAERIGQYLDAPGWLPAVGQGALAVACRADRPDVVERLRRVHDPAAAAATAAERANRDWKWMGRKGYDVAAAIEILRNRPSPRDRTRSRMPSSA